jgi:ELWxxDGT repeat protein
MYVPPTVPSLRHNSQPCIPSSPVKYRIPPISTKRLGPKPPELFWNSCTIPLSPGHSPILDFISSYYNINDKVNKCPQDNPGLELIIGYDDGNGNALPDDGVLQNDEIQSRIGECPGDNGMVQEFQNNSGGFGPSLLVEMGGILYFTGDDGIHGWELWRSDGTVGGTYMVKDVREEECTQTTNPGTGEETENCVNYGSMYVMCWPGDRCFFPELVAGENKIFFTGFDSNSNVNFPHVFVSDGTEEGTYRVRDQWINWDYNCAECDFNYSGPSNLMVIPDDGFNPDRLLYTVIQAICIGDYCNTEFYPASGEELCITIIANTDCLNYGVQKSVWIKSIIRDHHEVTRS